MYLYSRNTYVYYVEVCFYAIGTCLRDARVVNAKIYALSFTYKCTKMFTLINVSKYMETKEIKKKNEMSQQAGHGGSRPSSQHFERPRWAHHMRSGVGDQPDQHGETRCAY